MADPNQPPDLFAPVYARALTLAGSHRVVKELRQDRSAINHTSTGRVRDNEEVWQKYCMGYGNGTMDSSRHPFTFNMEYINAVLNRRAPNLETAMKYEPYHDLHVSELLSTHRYTNYTTPSLNMSIQEFYHIHDMEAANNPHRQHRLPTRTPPINQEHLQEHANHASPDSLEAAQMVAPGVPHARRHHHHRGRNTELQDKCFTCNQICDSIYVCPRPACPYEQHLRTLLPHQPPSLLQPGPGRQHAERPDGPGVLLAASRASSPGTLRRARPQETNNKHHP